MIRGRFIDFKGGEWWTIEKSYDVYGSVKY